MGRLTHVSASVLGLVSLFGGGSGAHHESVSEPRQVLPLPRGVQVALRVRSGRSARLYGRPGGRRVGAAGSRTEFGSSRLLPVLARRGGWLKVVADVSGRSSGWVRWSRRTLELTPERWQLVVDRSRGRLVVIAGGRAVKRLRVGVGRPGSPTPLGRLA